MAINTKRVSGRRKLRYSSLDDLLTDAENCAAGDTEHLGNWSPGQIFNRLAITLNNSIDGFDRPLPAPVRFILIVFMKNKFLNREIPSGFSAPKTVQPGEISTEAGLAAIRGAIDRQKRESKRALHPGFGKLTNEEWNAFHLRHAEMHMSFLAPKSA